MTNTATTARLYDADTADDLGPATDDQIEASDITDLATELAEKHGVRVNVQFGTWVEFALPTHRGHCTDDPTQTTGPGWDWVDHVGDQFSGLEIRGMYGAGQCGGCGQLNQGWACSGAVDLTDVADTYGEWVAGDPEGDEPEPESPEAVMVAILEALKAAVAETLSGLAEQTRARLRQELAEWMALPNRQLEDAMDPDEREYQPTGSDMEPGIYDESGYGSEWPAWVAWDYDPTDPDGSETITVAVAELTAASL